jgi:hypothetical protein
LSRESRRKAAKRPKKEKFLEKRLSYLAVESQKEVWKGYHSRHYWNKEVIIGKEVSWKRYKAYEREKRNQYKDINSERIKEYLDKK